MAALLMKARNVRCYIVIGVLLLCPPTGAAGSPEALDSLSRRFKTYRADHFATRDLSGWIDSLHNSDGGYYALMAGMCRMIDSLPAMAPSMLDSLMGPPDTVWSGTDIAWLSGKEVPSGARAWIYCWRGFHDFAYVIIHEQKAIRCAFWYAYE
jgi:hypothetical protein